MNRRIDPDLAEKLHIALLTKEAFGEQAAIRYASLAGIPHAEVQAILQRPIQDRRSTTAFGQSLGDRRSEARDGQG